MENLYNAFNSNQIELNLNSADWESINNLGIDFMAFKK